MTERSTTDGATMSARGTRWLIGLGLAVACALIGMWAAAGNAGALDDAAGDRHEDEPAHDHAAAGGHGHSDAISTPTATQQAAADDLVASVIAGATRYADFAAAAADGFVRVTPLAGGVGPAHYVNPAWVDDGVYLDPDQPESLIYVTTRDGERYLLGVMFLAPIGEGPTPAGPLTRWHSHEGMCTGPAAIGAAVDGVCPAGTVPIRSEMLHVWTFDHPDGPLAKGMDGPALLAAYRQLVWS